MEKSLRQLSRIRLDKGIRLKEHKIAASSGATLIYLYPYLKILDMW
jgi:hypothetical protein